MLSKPIICSLKVHGHINKSQSKNLTLLQTRHSCFPLVSFEEQRGKWEREESISVTKERKERVGDRQTILAPAATSINPDKPRDGNSWNTTGPRQGSSGPTLRVWKPTSWYSLQPGQTLSPGHCTSFLSTSSDFAYWQPNLLKGLTEESRFRKIHLPGQNPGDISLAGLELNMKNMLTRNQSRPD